MRYNKVSEPGKGQDPPGASGYQATKAVSVATLYIRLLGEFAAFYDGAPLTTVNSQRLQGLLAYLLLHRDAPLTRQRLAFLFWPDSTEPQARANLRNLIHGLIQALPDGERFIQTDPQTVQWRPAALFILDVDDLFAGLAGAKSAEDLQRAVDLYRGPLLPSCYDDWITPERERLDQKFEDALQGFVDRWEREGAYRDAITFAEQIVRRNPLREDLYRQIMRMSALSGDRAGVARTYRECRAVLARELQVEPSAETIKTYERCVRMEPRAVANGTVANGAVTNGDTLNGAVAKGATPDTPVAVIAPAPAPAGAPPATPNSTKRVVVTSRALTPAIDAEQIRRTILNGALQAPTTAVPLAIATMAAIFLVLLGSRSGWGGTIALVLLVAGGLGAAASFIWLYVVQFDHAYQRRSRALLVEQLSVQQEQQQAKVEALRARLRDGFGAIVYTEGQYSLKALDYEYNELKVVLARNHQHDPLAVAHLPLLANETYLRGLSVLEDALELARSISSPTNQRLEADLKELDARAKARSGSEDQIKLWREKATSMRQRLALIAQQRLRLQQLLQQADRCEGALQQTRIELASLKADAASGSVDAVLETLQKTIDQAKAIQEEMRKLGY
jgi:DNA-binding SARP family transcriptional activator